jgi:hypothetical protein
MKQYLTCSTLVFDAKKGDRTGTGTKKCFWIPNVFDLSEGL